MNRIASKTLLSFKTFVHSQNSFLHSTQVLAEIRKLARLRVVDNSEIGKSAMLEGRPPRVIHVYKPTSVGTTGL